jgi:phosphoadenosine phosphosulfate reductase
MSLIEHDLFRGRVDRVQIAIDRIKTFEPTEGYYLAYSGGKDSDTILELATLAGVKFDAHYNLTTVDPPELVWHVRKHPEVSINQPKETMWQLIVRKRQPPTRLARYCCEILKERNGNGRRVMTGIRAEESAKRASRKMVEPCFKDGAKTYFHPIIDWTSADVWEFLRSNDIEYCKLYDEGWKRLGCVLCPFSSVIDKRRASTKWPKIVEAYHRAVLRCFDSNVERGLSASTRFKDGEEMWQWWLSGKGKKEDGGLFI